MLEHKYYIEVDLGSCDDDHPARSGNPLLCKALWTIAALLHQPICRLKNPISPRCVSDPLLRMLFQNYGPWCVMIHLLSAA